MVEDLVIRGALQALIIFWVVVWTTRRAFRRFSAARNGGTNRDFAAGIAWLYPSVLVVYYLFSTDLSLFFDGLF